MTLPGESNCERCGKPHPEGLRARLCAACSAAAQANTRRWFVVSKDVDGASSGFVDAKTPLEAIKAWVGGKYDRDGIYVVPADHVLLFEPDENPDTVWLQQEAPE